MEEQEELRTYFTISEVRAHNRAIGQYWFSRGTMKSFYTTLGKRVYGGRYFISGERQDFDAPRRYSIRECRNGVISTVGEKGAYRTMQQAREALKNMLKEGKL